MKAASVRSESSEWIPYSPYNPSSVLGKDEGKGGIMSEAEERSYFKDN